MKQTQAAPTPTGIGEGFDRPYVDIDEQRAHPVAHRYIHGGFEGTGTRFSFYFPSPELYEGRFFQHITPVPDSENLAQTAPGREGKIDFAIASGAYFVETNGGGADFPLSKTQGDTTVAAYRANAAAAAYSRVIAAGLYGEHRPFGYAYGGSGGGYRTVAAAEFTTGVWDGFVPYVLGSPLAIPNVFSVRMHAMRVLGDKLDVVADAYDAGGSGDPFPELTTEEGDALREVTRMGFPPRSWFGHRTMGAHAFGVLYKPLVAMDADYFERFWTDEGYYGAELGTTLHRDRLVWHATVAGLVLEDADSPAGDQAGLPRGGVDQAFRGNGADSARVLGVRLTEAASHDSANADLVVTSGAAAGARLPLSAVTGDRALLDYPDQAAALAGLAPGDGVTIDNSDFLAAQTYHRHQVPGPDYAVWDQFRDSSGAPIPPQRPFLVGPVFTESTAGGGMSGVFDGKMILVSCLLDREAYPWQAAWYFDRVRAAGAADRSRLWYVDYGLHGDGGVREEHPTRSVAYIGVLHEALRQLAAWVERDVEPAASTAYELIDGQVVVPSAATERGGVQPVATLTAGSATGGDDARVTLILEAAMPADAGRIVRVDWDLDGDGEFEVTTEVEPTLQLRQELDVETSAAGTRFVTARVAAQGEGDPESIWAIVETLARVRLEGVPAQNA